MRLLYLSPVPIDLNNLDGVQKKIMSQASVLNEKIEVDIIYYFNSKVYIYSINDRSNKEIGRGNSKIAVIKQARGLIDKKKYEKMYIRYPRSDYFFISLLKKIKKNRVRTVIEIPTYPYDNENFTSFKSRMISSIDKLYRNQIHNYVERIITYSDDDIIFGTKTIKTVNGIDFSKNLPDMQYIDLKKEVKIIAVSAMFKLHGYDRVIEGLNNYYKNGGSRNIIFQLVGKGDEYQNYKNMTEKYHLENHVFFPGALFGEELDNVYKGCVLGVNSLAIHREGLEKESTLKTKEYASRGLPIMSSSYVDALSEEGNEQYVFHVSANEDAIDIDSMMQFINNIYCCNNVKTIRDNVRSDAYKVCDMRKTMQEIMVYLMSK